MGYKVAIRIRGYTDWIDYGYAVLKIEADQLAKEVERRVQIVTFPEGTDIKDVEKAIEEGRQVIFPKHGGDWSDYIKIDSGYTGIDQEKDRRNT